MPRELITIQIGQAGNQLGCRFWDMALSEHAAYSTNNVYDESMSSFFRHVSTRGEDALEIPLGRGDTPLEWLRARAVLVDMEEGVLNETLNGPLGELFDGRQLIKDVSGSGNNWAHGHCVYGPKYHDKIYNAVRQATELCDSLQSFFFIHSLGGGTGSGLGTYILKMLEDDFQDIYRFTTAVIPSRNDDVITSPYNSMLSLNELANHADCVLPIENQALIDICEEAGTMKKRGAQLGGGKVVTSTLSDSNNRNNKQKAGDGFDAMNTIAAHVLTNLTCSMRFPGSLNVDLNEITTNLVPFPGLHFLMPSLSPVVATFNDHYGGGGFRHNNNNNRNNKNRIRKKNNNVANNKSLDRVFRDSFSRKTQLICADPRMHMYLACAVIVRGPNISVSGMQNNIEHIKSKIKMAPWNLDGFKTGMCSTASIMNPSAPSALCLANNCAIADTFRGIQQDFYRSYKRKAHVHHYTKFMEEEKFVAANDKICDLIEAYELLDAGGAYKLGRTSNSSSSSSKMNDDRVKEGKGGEYNDSKEEEKRKKVSLLFNKNRGPVVGV